MVPTGYDPPPRVLRDPGFWGWRRSLEGRVSNFTLEGAASPKRPLPVDTPLITVEVEAEAPLNVITSPSKLNNIYVLKPLNII